MAWKKRKFSFFTFEVDAVCIQGFVDKPMSQLFGQEMYTNRHTHSKGPLLYVSTLHGPYCMDILVHTQSVDDSN